MHGTGAQNVSDPNDAGLRSATPNDFQRIREVFESALELPESERASYIAVACGSQPAIFAAVHHMLAADTRSFPLLDGIPQRVTRFWPGDTIAGQFVIEGLLGEGGMGQVYRCRDTTLGRTVAVKVLPERIAHNLDALARFRREAQLLASLNHPNIAVIHSTEEVDGVSALVLEFIEGPTLAELIANGPLPIYRAIAIGRQIADALETAHDAGITHRDLKPANVKVRADGTIKVLDFGLAKGRDAGKTTEERSAVGNGDPALTDGRSLMGTAAYMSPEQARGEQVDKRSDIWAFGAVLYEMLTGHAPFARDGISETLGAVLRDDIDWTKLPTNTPAAVRRLIERCLERNARRRLRDVGEARIALEDAATRPDAEIRSPRRRYMLVAVFLTALVVFVGIPLIKQKPGRQPATRLSIMFPDGHTLFANRSTIAISPDGKLLVYASPTGLRLRNLSALEFITIRGTESFFNINEPAFSPDGKWIAFHTSTDQTIKKIPIEGGTALRVCDALYPSSLTWERDGILYIEPGNAELAGNRGDMSLPRDGILLVSPEGGTPKHLVRARNREVFHGPQLLPDGRHLLFTVAEWGSSPDPWDNAQIVVQDLATGERRSILRGGTDARYVPAGYLVYAVAGSLIAASFDPRQLRLTGPGVPVVEGVRRADPASTGAANYSISSNGTLIYLPGPLTTAKELVITDRKGTREKLPLPAALYDTPRASPKGNQIAFEITEGGKSNIFIYDLAGQSAMRRLTLEGNNRFPAWSSNGKRIAYQSDRYGDRAIFLQRADGSGPAERLTSPAKDEAHEPEAWSPRDTILLFSNRRGTMSTLASPVYLGEVILSALSISDRQVHTFSDIRSSTPAGATFSPDGKWVAFASTVPYGPNGAERRGRTTVTVEPFPPTGARYELTHDGKPNHAQWSRDGRELFFVPGPEQFKSVPIHVHPTFSFGRAVSLPLVSSNAHTLKPRTYDIMPDGRFIGVFPGSYNNAQVAGDIVVVLNWLSELEERIPRSR